MQQTVGQIIWEQMRILDMNLIWCMGVKKPTLIENGLRFTVNGLAFKGEVEITLNASDLYDVRFNKVGRKLNKELSVVGVKIYDTVKTEMDFVGGVFVEDLMKVLEWKVEKGE